MYEKSNQTFFTDYSANDCAAVFISSQPDPTVAEFYRAMLTRWSEWNQELWFLETLDAYRYKKYFQIPQLRTALGTDSSTPAAVIVITDDTILRAVGLDEVRLGTDEPGREARVQMWGHVGSGRFWPVARNFTREFGVPMFITELMNQPRAKVLSGVPVKDEYTFREIVACQGPNGVFLTVARKWFEELKLELQQAEKEVAHVETGKQLFEF